MGQIIHLTDFQHFIFFQDFFGEWGKQDVQEKQHKKSIT
jgi:hypothetical protein